MTTVSEICMGGRHFDEISIGFGLRGMEGLGESGYIMPLCRECKPYLDVLGRGT